MNEVEKKRLFKGRKTKLIRTLRRVATETSSNSGDPSRKRREKKKKTDLGE